MNTPITRVEDVGRSPSGGATHEPSRSTASRPTVSVPNAEPCRSYSPYTGHLFGCECNRCYSTTQNANHYFSSLKIAKIAQQLEGYASAYDRLHRDIADDFREAAYIIRAVYDASAMSASGQDAKRLEATPASAVAEGETPNA